MIEIDYSTDTANTSALTVDELFDKMATLMNALSDKDTFNTFVIMEGEQHYIKYGIDIFGIWCDPSKDCEFTTVTTIAPHLTPHGELTFEELSKVLYHLHTMNGNGKMFVGQSAHYKDIKYWIVDCYAQISIKNGKPYARIVLK